MGSCKAIKSTLFTISLNTLSFGCFLFVGCSSNDKQLHEFQMKSIENEYQDRLDTGEGMLETTRVYYFKTDSIVNQAYSRKLKASSEILYIKENQRQWLLQREQLEDSLWKMVDFEFKKDGISSELTRMIAYGTIIEMNITRSKELLGIE